MIDPIDMVPAGCATAAIGTAGDLPATANAAGELAWLEPAIDDAGLDVRRRRRPFEGLTGEWMSCLCD